LSTVAAKFFNESVADDLKNWFPDQNGSEQRFAAALALVQHFVVINGGPGTGKTTTVAKILALLLKHVWQAPYPPQIALIAPTGKAATHMANALQRALTNLELSPEVFKVLSQLSGQTVHRLLQLRPPLLSGPFNANNPLPVDILIVDESSMLDLSLFRMLLEALKPEVRLILLGDANQLPAVGAGNVLAELSVPTSLTPPIAKQLIDLLPNFSMPPSHDKAGIAAHIATLTHSYRFDPAKGIGALATACIRGDDSLALTTIESFPQLHLQQYSFFDLCEKIYQLQLAWWQAVTTNNIQAVFSHLTDIIVLSVRRADAKEFNRLYRRYLGHQLQLDTESWFIGMPILITQNDYNIGLYNGDIGVILPDADDHQFLLAYFGDGQSYRKIALSRLPQHEPAFAITVHKSQGSEYEQVWLLAPQSEASVDDPLFNRALLYTALTRARNQFTFCGTARQLTQAIKNNERRRSGLKSALEKLFQHQSQLSLF
jgi:exodeoxyribonuclease V alpha subunit